VKKNNRFLTIGISVVAAAALVLAGTTPSNAAGSNRLFLFERRHGNHFRPRSTWFLQFDRRAWRAWWIWYRERTQMGLPALRRSKHRVSTPPGAGILPLSIQFWRHAEPSIRRVLGRLAASSDQSFVPAHLLPLTSKTASGAPLR